MESHETKGHNLRRQPPGLAKPAAIVLAIAALACAAVLIGGRGLPFQNAHATAPEAVNAAASSPGSETTDAATPNAPRMLMQARPVDHFPDHYENGATKNEEPVATF
jgi:hypothetical protein